MEVSIDEIKRLEKLKVLSKEFGEILDFVEMIKNAEVDETLEYNRVVSISDLREDITCRSMTQEEALMTATEKGEGAFVVPKVVD